LGTAREEVLTVAEGNVTSPDEGEELKAQLLKSVVEDNVDVIQGRLPPVVRPSARPRSATRWTGSMVAGSVAVTTAVALGGLALMGRTSTEVPVSRVRPETVALEGPPATDALPSAPAPASTATDAAVLTRTIDPGILALSVRRIVIDAGHGGENLGTSGARGLAEKDLTLDIAERVRHLIAARGFDVVMTRTSDETLSLQQRAATANGRRGDIFVSIHLNSIAPASAKGVETYFLGPSEGAEHDAIAAAENQHSGYSLSDMRALLERIYTDARRDESKRLATAVQRALVSQLLTVDPTIADRGVKMAPFVVLGATEMPAILAEVSCLSNPEEAERLRTSAYRQTLAEALVAGIQNFAFDSRRTASERTGPSGS
jgi:N-acetylmuramoyl-L-alanine amidase